MTNVDKRRTAREKVAPALLIVQMFFGSRAFAQTLLASSSWPTQRHDQARLALTPNAGPGAPLVSTVAAVSDNIGGEPTIAPDGSFYYVGRNSGIVALDANLHPKWTFATGGGNSGSTVRADGTVYAGGMSLWAIKPDGTLLWQIPSNYPYAGTLIFTTPAIASDGSVWTTRTDTQQVLKVDPNTGAILLTVPLAGVASATAMGPDGTIYVGGSNNSVTALNQNGSVKWSAAVTGPVYGTPMVHSNGQVLVAYNSVIQAINANGTLAWSFQEPAAGTGFSVNALAEGPDGTILAPDTGSYLYALNPANGALKWTYSGTLGDGFSQAGFFVDSAGNIFITGYNNAQRTLGLYSISSTGIRNWFLALSGSVGVNSPILDASGNLYIGAGLSGTAGQITKLSPPSPSTFLASSPWPTQRHDVARSALTGNAAPSAPLVSGVFTVGDNIGGEPTIAPDGSFYFVGRSSGIIALDVNLNQKWTFATGGGNSGSTVRADGTVYAGGMSLWAIKPDGTLLWQIPSNYPYAGTLIFTTPVVASDGSVWTTRTDTQQVLKVNPNTGAVQITLSLAGVASGAALGPDGTIYVGGSGGQVYAIKQDGSIKWSATVGGPIYGTPMLHSSGMVIVAYNSAIQALTSNGALAWSFQEPPAGTGFGVNALAQGPDGTIYAPDTGSYLYALNPATGALKWTYSGVLGDGFSQAGFFVDNTGSVFITGYNNAQRALGLYSINNAGTRNWFLPLSGSPGVNSPVLDASGNLYVGAGLSATTGQITKISPPSPATFLAVSPWPTQRHDQARLALTANAAPSVPIISTTAAIGDNIGGEPSIAPDGSFYLVGSNSGIIALDASLNPKWTFATGGGNAATTVRADGTVYAGGQNLWAVKPNGTLLWEIASNYPYPATLIFTTPVIASDGSLWTTRTDTHQVFKIDPNSGAIRQTVNLAGVVSAASLGPDGTLYVGGSNNMVYALNQDGSVKWSAAVSGPVYGTPLVHSNGMIYVAYNGSIQAINANGTLAWSFQEPPAGTGFSVNSLAEGPDGTVYAPDTGAYLYAFNPTSGVLKWTYAGILGDGFSQAGFFVDSAGSVFITGYNYAQRTLGLYSISNAGARNWFLPLSGSAGVNSPVLDASGNLYIGAGLNASVGQMVKIAPGFVVASTTTLAGRPELAVTSVMPGLSVVSISTVNPTVAVALASATATGLQLVSDVFEISPSTAFTPAANITFRFDPAVVIDTSTLAIFRFDGVSWSSAGVISSQLVALGSDPQVTATLAHTSYYGLFRAGDHLPPRTSLVIGMPGFSAGSNTYVSSATLLTLTAVDDLQTVGDARGIGVAHTFISVDSAIFSSYTGSFALTAPGTHSLSFYSVDKAGNMELPSTGTVFVDTTPPALTLLPAAGSFVVVSTPQLSAIYTDYGSGVSTASVSLSLDGVSVTTQATVLVSSASYSPIFALAQGTHTFSATSSDNVGNAVIAASTFLIDTVPPVTALMVDGLAASTTTLVIVSTDSLGFAATDTGTGVAQTLYSLDGGSMTVYVSTFNLTAGSHTLAYRSRDNAGNMESTRSSAFTVLLYDVTPPSVTLTPLAGSTITTTTPQIAAAYSDSGRGVDASSVRLSLDGQDVTSAATVTVSSAIFVPPAALTQSTHSVVIRVSDFAGNQAIATTTFLVDSVPPITTLLVDGLSAATTNLLLVSTDTLGFIAADAGTGVAQTLYALDGGVEIVYASSFSLSAGAHLLSFHSRDIAGNLEGIKTISLSVQLYDIVPPSVNLVPPSGSTVTTATPSIVATYTDIGRGVDVSSVRLFLDGVDITSQTAVTVSTAIFVSAVALTQANHVAVIQVADLAGNRAISTSTFFVDSIPPVTTLLVDGLVPATTNLVLVSTDSLGFTAFDAGTGVAQTLFALDGGSMTVYTSTFSLSAGNHTLAYYSRDIAGNMGNPKTASLAVLSYDIIPPSVTMTPPSGSTITTATPSIVAAYSDIGRGVDVSSVKLFLDGVNVTTQAVVTVSSATFVPPSALAQAGHIAVIQVADLAGNRSISTSTFFLDSIPPVTILLVNGLTASATNLIVVSTDILSFTATDAGTGIAQTLYSIDGSSEAVFGTSFTLAVGAHILAFHSRDNAGNLETRKSDFISVQSTGAAVSAPPSVSLTFPSPTALGVEQTLGGVVNVRGAVYDANLQSWTLSVAPGVAVSSGFSTIASGIANVSGQFAAWNTSALTGYFTLKLTARNASGANASTTATVFIGRPFIDFSIGKRDSNVVIASLKNPQGIVVRPDGLIWVAVDDDNRLLLMTSSGTLAGTVGAGRANDDGEDRDDGHGRVGRTIVFNHPRGLSLDAAMDLYVADRDDDRVVKLSPDGAQVLLEFNSGLKHPNDAVVDADGSVFVADTEHARVRVFGPSGAVLRDIPTGSGGRPWGVALSSQGLWVSDQARQTISLFTRAGVLLKTIAGGGRVRGAAVDHVEALYVVDRSNDRLNKYDPLGSSLWSIGARRDEDDGARRSMAFLSDPSDAAVGPDGALWVADSGHDRIVRYELPTAVIKNAFYTASVSLTPLAAPANLKTPAARNVDPIEGGKVERDDGTGVRVPSNALASTLQLTVQSADATQDADAKQKRRLANKIQPASEEVQYGPEGTTFAVPVTITINYDPAQIATQGLSEDQLKVHYWNPTLGDWQALDSVVDKDAKTVSAQTSHFSLYQAMGPGGIGVAAADASFGLKAAYAFPNPVRGVNAATIRIQPGLADSVEVHVYDLSGRKIHSSSAFTLNTLDDGNGLGAQFTYDHVWDVSGVGSGVYTYVITARKAGQSDIHKTGKIGVAK